MAVAAKTRKVFDDRYEIIDIVGRGSDSVVYHARPLDNPTFEVALKVLVEKKDGTPLKERLRREALALVSSRSPYVLHLEDFHSKGPLSYLSLEFAPESDLRSYLTKVQQHHENLSNQTILTFALQLAQALEAVHRAGIIHRDIKPENIVVMHPELIKLCDFGLALLPGELWSPEDLAHGVGTLGYLAPELIEGKQGDDRSDLYALGVVLAELVLGRHPFADTPLAQTLDVRRSPVVLPPTTDWLLEDTIQRLLAFEPSARVQSASELIRLLSGEAAGLSSTITGALPAEHSAIATANPQNPGATAYFDELPPLTQQSQPTASEQTAFSDPFADPYSTPSHAQPGGESAYPAPTSTSTTPPATPPVEAEPTDEELEKLFDEIFGPLDKNDQGQQPPPGNSPVSVTDPFGSYDAPSSHYTPPSSPASSGTVGDQSPFDPYAIPTGPAPTANSTPASTPAPEKQNGKNRQTQKFKPAYLNDGRGSGDTSTPHVDAVSASTGGVSATIKHGIVLGVIAGLIVLALRLIFISPGSPKTVKAGRGTSTTIEAPVHEFKEAQGIARTNNILPRASGAITSPILPAGTYRGSITGIVPGITLPLLVIVSPSQSSMTWLVGVDGFAPITFSTADLTAPRRVASSGRVLEVVAQVSEQELVGALKNLTTGVIGTFTIARG